jgi:hypothetical protein
MHRVAAALALLSLIGCAETSTIRQLGHPEFEQVVGKDTQFERVGAKQVQNLDAFPARADEGANHRFVHSIDPRGTDEVVILDVRAGPHPDRGVPLASLSVGVYPVKAQEAMAFAHDGRLPAPEQPLTVVTTKEKIDGILALIVKLPRTALPADAERIACPILVEFEDGWIHLYYYQTVVPAPPKPIEPTDLQPPATEAR